MPDGTPASVTDLLIEWRQGSSQALDRLVEMVYRDLEKIARLRLRRERRDHSLDPTAPTGGMIHSARICGKC